MPAFSSLANEVGRVAEEGATIHVALGNGSVLQEEGIASIASLQGLVALTDLAAAYDTPPFITTSDPGTLLIAENQMRDAYAKLGQPAQLPLGRGSLYGAGSRTLCCDGSHALRR